MTRHWGLSLIGLLLLCAPGCAGTKLFHMAAKPPADSVSNPVIQIVALWEVAEGQDGNGKTCRGFGGQIFFITRQKQLPSTVKGKVRISLFDDQCTPEEQSKPLHQYDFTPEAWATHVQHSKLGPAYSAFIPYPRPGMKPAQCSLHIHYESEDHRTASSPMVNVLLPGVEGSTTDGPPEPQMKLTHETGPASQLLEGVGRHVVQGLDEVPDGGVIHADGQQTVAEIQQLGGTQTASLPATTVPTSAPDPVTVPQPGDTPQVAAARALLQQAMAAEAQRGESLAPPRRSAAELLLNAPSANNAATRALPETTPRKQASPQHPLSEGRAASPGHPLTAPETPVRAGVVTGQMLTSRTVQSASSSTVISPPAPRAGMQTFTISLDPENPQPR